MQRLDVRHLLDVQAVTDVVHRNAFALDARDWTTLRTCYTQDVVTSSRQSPRHGFEAFRAKAAATLEPLSASQHLIGAVRVQVDGEVATSLSTFQAQHVMAGLSGGTHLIVAGRYVDEWRRVGPSWLIARRDLVVIWTRGNAAVLAR